MPSVAKRFQEIGLKTELVQDVGRDAIFAAIEKFKASASGANIAALYFAGHGASWDKDTYLVPVDADLGTPETVRTLLPVKAISAAMSSAAHRLMVFDNCRNNPADGWRQRDAAISAYVSAAERTAAVLHGPSTLVLFSTAPGHVALDGPAGEISPFAAAFLRQFDGPSIDLTAFGAKVRRDLLIATEGQQVVWDESTYTAAFSLEGRRGVAARNSQSTIDPSRILELPNAYAFARQKNLVLPEGLIVIRPSGGSPHSEKVGAYETTRRASLGNTTSAYSDEPMIVVVLCVDGGGMAPVIIASRLHGGGISDTRGSAWGLRQGALSADKLKLEFPPSELKWKDSNGGTFVQIREDPVSRRHTDKLIRLD